MSLNKYMAATATAAVVGCVWAVARISGNGRSQGASSGAARTQAYEYAAPTTRPAGRSVGSDIDVATAQWPATPECRMEAMTNRLDRVAKAIGQAAGTHCIARLGASDRAVALNDDGTVVVDAVILWKLSEDALAALVAREMAHEVLGHRAEMELIRRDRESNSPGALQRERAMETAADELAGRILARTKYSPDGFLDALRQTGSYSVGQRWTAFQRGYAQGSATSQPSKGAE